MTLQRMWINQPSTLQPLHHLHGTLVLATAESDTVMKVFFLSGDTISQQVPRLALSGGWPAHLARLPTVRSLSGEVAAPTGIAGASLPSEPVIFDNSPALWRGGNIVSEKPCENRRPHNTDDDDCFSNVHGSAPTLSTRSIAGCVVNCKHGDHNLAPETKAESHSVQILWGQTPEPDQEPVTYEYPTRAEFDAFMDGVEAASGWLDYQVVPEDDV